MEYTIREKTFKIDFVSNYVHEKYSELEDMLYTLVKETKLEGIDKLIEDNPEDALEKLKGVDLIRKKYQKDIVLLRREIIKEIIETNGLDYDLAWWSRKTSPDDINEFMVGCIRKDLTNAKTTKKK